MPFTTTSGSSGSLFEETLDIEDASPYGESDRFNFLFLEDGEIFLLEEGGRILLEDSIDALTLYEETSG